MIEDQRSGTLTAGGVLAIISGALAIIGGIVVAAVGVWLATLPWVKITWIFSVIYLPIGIALVILSILAIVGGIRALAMRSFGWALTGGICALLCCLVPGILALIFIGISRKDFG